MKYFTHRKGEFPGFGKTRELARPPHRGHAGLPEDARQPHRGQAALPEGTLALQWLPARQI